MANLALTNGVYVLTFSAAETRAMQYVVQQHPRGETGMLEVVLRPVDEWVRHRVQAIKDARHQAYQTASPEARTESDRLIGFTAVP